MHDHDRTGPGFRQARHGGASAGHRLTDLLGLVDPADLKDLTEKEVEEVLRRLLFMFRWLLTGGPNDVEDKLKLLVRSTADLTKTAKELDDKLKAANEVLARQQAQLALIQGALSRLQDDQHDRHAELGAKWQKLLGDRELVRLVEQAVTLAPGRTWDPADQSPDAHWARVRDEATARRASAELLIAADEVDLAALERLLVPAGAEGTRERAEVAELAARAAGLHRAASGLKYRPAFDFSPPEPVVTPETAILFSPECGYGRRAAYVVLPAYRLNDKRLTLPTVLTDRAAPAGERTVPVVVRTAAGGTGRDTA
ncbi:hypothetical protein [Streptomyces sp. NRRL F-5123]|uniref:hypothetical protein n=1 Tax=Streptomyces sp. NRRL F-5123 TaxID=1463856 RepID=UPI0004E0BFFA|nr:hypothetical protein [Streptomyces sp. NRRL F-5123]